MLELLLLLLLLFSFVHFGDVLLLHWGHDEAGVSCGAVLLLWVVVQGAGGS